MQAPPLSQRVRQPWRLGWCIDSRSIILLNITNTMGTKQRKKIIDDKTGLKSKIYAYSYISGILHYHFIYSSYHTLPINLFVNVFDVKLCKRSALDKRNPPLTDPSKRVCFLTPRYSESSLMFRSLFSILFISLSFSIFTI